MLYKKNHVICEKVINKYVIKLNTFLFVGLESKHLNASPLFGTPFKTKIICITCISIIMYKMLNAI